MSRRRPISPELSADLKTLGITAADYKTIDDLADRAQAGDQTAKQKLIEVCTNYAISCATKHSHKVGFYYLDDLIGIALTALVEAVNSLASRQRISEPNTLAFISIRVWGALRQTHDDGVSASHLTRKRHRHGHYGRELDDIPTSHSASQTADVTEFGETGIADCHTAKPCFLADLWDEILACCWSETQRQIVRLKAEGHDAKEIAAQVGVSKHVVNHHLRQILDRYEHPEKRAKRHGNNEFHGVSFDKRRNVFQSYVRIGNKQVPTGKAKTAEAAARIREDYITKHNLSDVKSNADLLR